MQFHVLATDYDGTLATDGVVPDETIRALERLRNSGRKILLVTGRIIPQLLHVFPQLKLCDLVVADNGAVLYEPTTGKVERLADPPPQEFILELAKRGVPELEVGDVIVATWEPHEATVLQTIRDLRLELQIIFNKGSVMILPTGVNKATGLRAALNRMGLSHLNAVGVGDAENDQEFLKHCGISVAVDNALQVVKDQVDIVTRGARGAGVAELIDQLILDDFAAFCAKRAAAKQAHASDNAAMNQKNVVKTAAPVTSTPLQIDSTPRPTAEGSASPMPPSIKRTPAIPERGST
ncbi:MAG: HAD family hydrolase [Pirellulales bacterium]